MFIKVVMFMLLRDNVRHAWHVGVSSLASEQEESSPQFLLVSSSTVM